MPHSGKGPTPIVIFLYVSKFGIYDIQPITKIKYIKKFSALRLRMLPKLNGIILTIAFINSNEYFQMTE